MNTRPTSLALTAALIAIMGTACTSTITGEEGNLKFSYYSSDDASNFNKPIAIGARLEVRVEDAGSGDNDDTVVELVSSSDEAIIKASKGGGDTIILEGIGEGSAQISVDAAVARTSTTESDRFTMRTAVPESIELSNLCDSDGDQFYLVSEKEIFLGYDMKLNDGQEVIGYGYYPLSVEPEGGVTIKQDSKTYDFVVLETGSTAGQITLTSEVSDESWTINLVEPAAIDGAALLFEEAVDVGESETFRVEPTVQGSTICQSSAVVDIEVLTPEVCDVEKLEDEAEELTSSLTRLSGWLKVSGKQVGDCKFTATYAAGNGGEGAAKELTISVQNGG